jgi:hypothetical protein
VLAVTSDMVLRIRLCGKLLALGLVKISSCVVDFTLLMRKTNCTFLLIHLMY